MTGWTDENTKWFRFLKSICITTPRTYACTLYWATQALEEEILFIIQLNLFVQLEVLCPSRLDFTNLNFQCLSLLHGSIFSLLIVFVAISSFPKLAPLISPYVFICFFYAHHAVSVHFSKLSLCNFFSLFGGTHYHFFLLYFSAIMHWNCWSILIV